MEGKHGTDRLPGRALSEGDYVAETPYVLMCSRMLRTVRHIIRTATYERLCGPQHNLSNACRRMRTDVPRVVHGRADRRVPHQLLHCPNVHHLHQPLAATESLQIVNPNRQPHPLGSATQRLVEIHTSRLRPAVDEHVRCVQVTNQTRQVSGRVLRERNLPRLVVLCRPGCWTPPEFGASVRSGSRGGGVHSEPTGSIWPVLADDVSPSSPAIFHLKMPMHLHLSGSGFFASGRIVLRLQRVDTGIQVLQDEDPADSRLTLLE